MVLHLPLKRKLMPDYGSTDSGWNQLVCRRAKKWRRGGAGGVGRGRGSRRTCSPPLSPCDSRYPGRQTTHRSACLLSDGDQLHSWRWHIVSAYVSSTSTGTLVDFESTHGYEHTLSPVLHLHHPCTTTVNPYSTSTEIDRARMPGRRSVASLTSTKFTTSSNSSLFVTSDASITHKTRAGYRVFFVSSIFTRIDCGYFAKSFVRFRPAFAIRTSSHVTPATRAQTSPPGFRPAATEVA